MKKIICLLYLIALLFPMRVSALVPYAALSNNNKVLTFYYDSQFAARGGMSVAGQYTRKQDRQWDDVSESITSVIFDKSFAECTSLTSTSYWFYGCYNLTSITGLENLKTDNVIDMSYMFSGCSCLKSLDLSCLNTSNVTNTERMFYSCSSLASVTIPNSMTSIGSLAFCSSGLTSVTIPNSVTSIGKAAFQSCGSLSYVMIGNGVTSIGEAAFSGCKTLTTITIPNGLTFIENYTFNECNSLTSIAIPSNVTNIGSSAFSNCYALTSITIPANVTSIGDNAFAGCIGLNYVYSLIKKPFRFGNYAFHLGNDWYFSSTRKLIVPIGTRDAYIAAGWTQEIFRGGVVEEESPIISFADPNVKSICVANWDTNGDGELSEEEAAAVMDIGEVFKEKSITSFNELQYFIGLTKIPYRAFYHCDYLTSVTFPNSINSIEDDAFYECRELKGPLTFPESLIAIGNYVFIRCNKITGSLLIPNSVTSIGEAAFYGCTGLTGSLSLPNSVTSIGDAAFYDCYGLTGSLVIPDSLTSIGEGTFAYCRGLTGSLTIPISVKTIKNDAFRECSGFTGTLSISNHVESIGLYSFYGCLELNTIIIPNSVTAIGGYAFSNCYNVNLVISQILTPFTISNVFSSTGAVLQVPKGTKGQYEALSGWKNAFKEITEYAIDYNLTITSIGKGTVSFAGSAVSEDSKTFPVTEGDDAEITITPDEGYRIKSVKVNGTDVTSRITNNQYTISNITTDTSLEVEFETIATSPNIVFADPNVKSICVANWDTNGDGELSESEAASVKDLGTVFKGNKNITSFDELRFFTGLSEITSYAFYQCAQLISITIPTSVTKIGDKAFCDCCGISGLFIIPASVKYIGAYAFYNCNNISVVIIPKLVSFIGDYAFVQCPELTTIVVRIENPLNINGTEFSNYSNTKLFVPKGTLSSYQSTNYWKDFKQIEENRENEKYYSVAAIGSGVVIYKNQTLRNSYVIYSTIQDTIGPLQMTPDADNQIVGLMINGKDFTNQISNKLSTNLTLRNVPTDINIKIKFSTSELLQHNLFITSKGNGTVEYNGIITRDNSSSFVVTEATSIVLSFAPDIGYRIKCVKINGADITSNVNENKYTISSIYEDTSLEVEFEEILSILSIKSVGNGSATYDETAIRSKTSTFTVSYGTDAVVSFTPDEGYRIKSVKVNGTDVTSKVANNQYTISNITVDTSLEVEFERITYTLSITATGSGTVSYNDVATRGKTNAFNVVESSSVTMAITADDGYRIKSLKVNSVDVTSNIKDGKYTISSVTSNTTVEVVFEAIPNYTINILATGNGNVGYEGTVIRNQSQSYSVREGRSVTISFSPDKGYRVASVKVNKTDMTGQVVDGQLMISNISSNTSIEVAFEAIPPTTYTLTVKVGDNGSVTYDGTSIRNKSNTFTIVEGTYVTITLTPDEGYCVKSVKLNNEDVTSNVKNNQYTISGIGANTSIEVEFEEIICTLSIKSIGNGSATYDETSIRSKTSTFNLSYGADAVVSFNPDEGYRIKSVKVNGTDITSKVANNQYTISKITVDTSLEVEFERISYTFIISATGNGTVIYSGTNIRGKSSSFTLIEGTDADITITPDAGYRVKSVKLNSRDITSSITDLQYTITNISANTLLEVVFEAIPTYTINIVSSGNGRVTYSSVVVRNQSREFSVKEGNSISILFAADNGYRLASVNVNDKDLIGQVVNNKLTIENITADTNIEVTFEVIPITTYSIIIKSTGEGVVTYEGTAIRKQNKMFTVAEGTNAVVVITPDEGYRIKSVTLNGTDVISNVVNYMYSTKIESNTTLEVEFMEDVMEFAIDNVNYKIVSYGDKTIQLASGNYGITLTVPATCTANDRQWTVIGVEADALANCTDLAAIIWNPEAVFNGNVRNPNLLLYVKDKSYGGKVKNVIVNGEADKIILQDASDGNNFYCPQAFTAKSITYEHNYSMKSGYNTCQGWETLVLPFDVTQILRQGGTELVPHSAWTVGSSQRPFWLYSLTELGWKKERSIAANTPYIICMPNNENYNAKYNISGVVQFIGTNVQVKASDNLNVGMKGNKKLIPNYQNQQADATIYALNVNNQWCQNTSTEVEGSTFISSLRTIRPFEAYLSVTGADAARRAIPIFEEGESTGIIDIPLREDIIDDTWYTIDGRKLFTKPTEKGVYLNGGKKIMVK